jgi:hypothetical protein
MLLQRADCRQTTRREGSEVQRFLAPFGTFQFPFPLEDSRKQGQVCAEGAHDVIH